MFLTYQKVLNSLSSKSCNTFTNPAVFLTFANRSARSTFSNVMEGPVVGV